MDARVDEEDRKVTVVVADDQLSLAIGKQGQNVRLAAKLTGWKIELHSESEFQAKAAAAEANVAIEDLEGIYEGVLETLRTAGITTALDIETRGLDGLMEVEGLGENSAERLYGVALAALANARSAAAVKAAAAGVTEDDEDQEAPVFGSRPEEEGPDLVPQPKASETETSEADEEGEAEAVVGEDEESLDAGAADPVATESGADEVDTVTSDENGNEESGIVVGAGEEGDSEGVAEPDGEGEDEDDERPHPDGSASVAVEEGPTGS